MGNRKKDGSQARDGASPASGEKFSLISDEKLIELYKNLLKYRRQTGRRAGNSSRAITPRIHEAAMVGTAIDLGAGDMVCSLDLEVLAAVSEGNVLDRLLSHSSDHRTKGSRASKKSAGPNGRSETPLAHAVIGTALASKTAKNGKIAVVYCNGKDSGSLRETIHIATIHALPIIFVHQLDRSASRQTKSPLAMKLKKGHADETPWYPSIAVDSDDLVAVYRVASESISRARLGRGPTLIECHMFRPLAGAKNGRHTRDSVANMEHYLRAKGLFDPKLKRDAAAELHNR